MRTCVGCRGRAQASELLRVVADAAEPSSRVSGGAEFVVIPDPHRRRPGRGAHVHPDPICLGRAEKRHAFGRALRVVGIVDTSPLDAYVNSEQPMVGHPPRTQQGRTTDMSTR